MKPTLQKCESEVKVKITQSCPALCDPMDYTVHGLLQARILEWVAFPFSRGSSQPRDQTQVSHIVGKFFTSWATRETSVFMGNYMHLCMHACMLSCFSRVLLCATPQTAAHQAPPSLGFSRQEHWNGLPFPSPMHESEKWKWSRSVVSDSVRPNRRQPTRLPRPWDFPGKNTGMGCHFLLQRMKVKSESEVA